MPSPRLILYVPPGENGSSAVINHKDMGPSEPVYIKPG